MAIRGFRDAATEDINCDRVSKNPLPHALHETVRVKLARLHAASRIEDLATLPGNRLEKRSGDRAGQSSIRLNDRYRICFVWTERGAELVEIVDYH